MLGSFICPYWVGVDMFEFLISSHWWTRWTPAKYQHKSVTEIRENQGSTFIKLYIKSLLYKFAVVHRPLLPPPRIFTESNKSDISIMQAADTQIRCWWPKLDLASNEDFINSIFVYILRNDIKWILFCRWWGKCQPFLLTKLKAATSTSVRNH